MITPTTTTAPVSPGVRAPGGDRCNPSTQQEQKGSFIMAQLDDNLTDRMREVANVLESHVAGETSLDPVNLDPPDPVLARWNELAHRDNDIEHNGDAEKIIPFPRPAWADPDNDIIGRHRSACYYTSEWVEVPLSYVTGDVDETYWERAGVRVRAKLCGDGGAFVGLTDRRVVDGKWQWSIGVGITPAEATELAHVLLAAVELIERGTEGGAR